MQNTLSFIIEKYQVKETQSPVALPMSRFKELPRLFRELGFKKGVEIGVYKGLYSKVLCKMIAGLELYCVDPWEAYDGYVEQQHEKGQENLNNYFEIAKERLKDFNCHFIRKYSSEAVKDFADESLDFVFIDGNHSFEYVVEDIAKWSKKVRKGGIVAGHDYWRSADGIYKLDYQPNQEQEIKLCQVPEAIDGWTKANKIKWFITTKDKCNSWFYAR